jgi:hypothetical protein
MNQKNTDDQREGQLPETSDASQATTSPELVNPSPKVEKPQPSRLQRFFRKVLIWLVVLAVTFVAGIATDHFLRYVPLSKAIVDTERLTIEIQEANDKITSLESGNKASQDELENATAHLRLLQVLVDVSNARLALFLTDVEGAKTSLINTQERLDDLLPRITEFDTNLAQSMPQRLSLIVSGLERDTETAKIDLELFTKDLLEIEAGVFGN